MKDEYKILIGAIVVILIVLVGAYALSGSNNPGPAVSPTVTPTTNPAATAVPGGEGGNEGTPSATPTIVPTATPVPTPTPEPESGVKQTEFGYWITYPPLPPENWSSPKPQPAPAPENNTVYFDQTSGSIRIGNFTREGYYSIPVVIDRNGDLSGPTTVHIQIDTSDNIELDSLYTWYYLSPNAVFSDDHNFNVTFAPGHSSETITVYFEGLEDSELESINALAEAFQGSVHMTIVDAGNGYLVGANSDYTLDVGRLPKIYFYHSGGNLWKNGSTVDHNGGFSAVTDVGNGSLFLAMNLGRDLSFDGAFPVTVYVVTDLDPSQWSYANTPTFHGGDTWCPVGIYLNKSSVLSGAHHDISVSIDDSEDYMIGSYSTYNIHINNVPS